MLVRRFSMPWQSSCGGWAASPHAYSAGPPPSAVMPDLWPARPPPPALQAIASGPMAEVVQVLGLSSRKGWGRSHHGEKGSRHVRGSHCRTRKPLSWTKERAPHETEGNAAREAQLVPPYPTDFRGWGQRNIFTNIPLWSHPHPWCLPTKHHKNRSLPSSSHLILPTKHIVKGWLYHSPKATVPLELLKVSRATQSIISNVILKLYIHSFRMTYTYNNISHTLISFIKWVHM